MTAHELRPPQNRRAIGRAECAESNECAESRVERGTLTVDGIRNLRDIGGYPTVHGRVTSWRRLLRSGAPETPDAAQGLVDAVPLTLVIDLRDVEETDEIPSPFPDLGVPTSSVPIFGGSASSFVAADFSLAELYQHMIATAGEAFVRVVEAIAATEGTCLVHCTIGKDRTGLAVGLLLDALDIERDTVVADYALTQSHLDEKWRRARLDSLEQIHGRDLSGLIPLLAESPASVMRAALADVDREWGGSARYFFQHGLDASVLASLEAGLTEEAHT